MTDRCEQCQGMIESSGFMRSVGAGEGPHGNKTTGNCTQCGTEYVLVDGVWQVATTERT
jgi:hypothetical protein